MSTNIILFVFFSIITSILYYYVPINKRRYLLLFVNGIFYFMCDSAYSFLIVLSVLFSYICAIVLDSVSKYSIRKMWLIVGIAGQCLLLAFFKYNDLLRHMNNGFLKLAMPLGISYYSFKIISYLVDVYHKKVERADIINYAIYISFFPQIVCGPITRSGEITDYIDKDLSVDYETAKTSAYLIISGLFKKLVIADRLGGYVDTVLGNITGYPSLALWMAAVFYTIQLYCDFAGYSEIVIGVSRLFGFQCKENFNLPYFSCSIEEFWNRWHISLSTWLRDYVYIPLGGNKVGKWRKKRNVLITFMVSGIWHGNGPNYLLWGLYHGILNMLSPAKSSKRMLSSLQVIITFLCVMFGWLFFKLNSIVDAFICIKMMFSKWSFDVESMIASVIPFTNDYACLSYLLTVSLFITILFILEWRDYSKKSQNKQLRMVVYFIAIVFWGIIGQNSFIYANF